MINSQDFIKRLQIIIDHYQLSAASLADKIAVQRSSISLSLFPSELIPNWLLDASDSDRAEGKFPVPLSNEKTTEMPKPLKEPMLHSIHNNTQDEIEAVIICYKNGNFKSYKNLD